MNYSRVTSMIAWLWRSPISLFVLLGAFAVSAAQAQSTSTGSISGTVTSASTRNALQGATVSIPSLNLVEFTDNSGRFVMSGVPAGVVDVVVTYSGFNEGRQKVTVSSGAPSQVNLELKTSDIVTMQAFTVESVKEGSALALTEQRNAMNVKNVTAFDEWGILPTQNVGELASRLPGITFTTDEDQLINNISIGGQPSSYTRLKRGRHVHHRCRR
jgi:iron complex outermembrane receptor protein